MEAEPVKAGSRAGRKEGREEWWGPFFQGHIFGVPQYIIMSTIGGFYKYRPYSLEKLRTSPCVWWTEVGVVVCRGGPSSGFTLPGGGGGRAAPPGPSAG